MGFRAPRYGLEVVANAAIVLVLASLSGGLQSDLAPNRQEMGWIRRITSSTGNPGVRVEAKYGTQ